MTLIRNLYRRFFLRLLLTTLLQLLLLFLISVIKGICVPFYHTDFLTTKWLFCLPFSPKSLSHAHTHVRTHMNTQGWLSHWSVLTFSPQCSSHRLSSSSGFCLRLSLFLFIHPFLWIVSLLQASYTLYSFSSYTASFSSYSSLLLSSEFSFSFDTTSPVPLLTLLPSGPIYPLFLSLPSSSSFSTTSFFSLSILFLFSLGFTTPASAFTSHLWMDLKMTVGFLVRTTGSWKAERCWQLSPTDVNGALTSDTSEFRQFKTRRSIYTDEYVYICLCVCIRTHIHTYILATHVLCERRLQQFSALHRSTQAANGKCRSLCQFHEVFHYGVRLLFLYGGAAEMTAGSTFFSFVFFFIYVNSY